ncbi:MAG TPA: 4Fe-4S dicluster domain-containing protein [Pirellulaceae bacterium]|nr:4Fe-4S dicluster domain-containing protein [Pirellulaceae bacterium]HMO92391.1 4Fe-4S dicluster domain-containing protein [Pirellulaceae bacterium]HMP69511.1 4Fe-4S dicluster domain-containing protein [Pirellulaceae bacterium]
MNNEQDPKSLEPSDSSRAPKDGVNLPILGQVSRRTAIKGAAAVAGATALGVAASPMLKKTLEMSAAEFMQRHFKELTDDDKQQIFERLENDARQQYAADVQIDDQPPIPGVRFGYAINLSLCNGNGKCMEACHLENNHDRATHQSYIRIFEMPIGTTDFEHGSTSYDHEVPQKDHYYLPVQCFQCDNPPCVSVCPVEATWQESDGIVVVDYNWCIGCRYCMAACPYHARRFNWAEPTISAEEVNPNQGYLSNRIRPQGVVEKCHFCLHRTRLGKLPACLEACPTGARIFGDLMDPDSNIRWVLANKRCFTIKEELGTKPMMFYFFD